MKRLLEIATELEKAYRMRSSFGLQQANLQQDIEGRKLYITPADGWPGKNEGERKIAAEKVFAADEILQAQAKDLRTIDEVMWHASVDIEVLEAERRALEWTIRGRLVEALAGKREGHGDVVENGFDDAAQAAAEEAGIEEAALPEGSEPPVFPPDFFPNPDEIPF